MIIWTIVLVVPALIGSWVIPLWIFGPSQLRKRMTRRWGWPQFYLSDYGILLVMLVPVLLLVSVGSNEYGAWHAASVTLLLITAIGYVWVRGVFILDQLRILRPFSRGLFLAVVIPMCAGAAWSTGYFLIVVILVVIYGLGESSAIKGVVGMLAQSLFFSALFILGARALVGHLVRGPTTAPRDAEQPSESANEAAVDYV